MAPSWPTDDTGQAVDRAPRPTLTVAAVARRLGVAPATLRTWDRRYAVGPSAHTAGAHRRYSSADLARLVVMRQLTLQGVAPSEAARIAVATPVRESAHDVLATVTALNPPGAEGGVVSPAPGQGRTGGGRVIALPDASPAARGLARAAMALDSVECSRILREVIRADGIAPMWEALAVPVLVALGDKWQATGTAIEVEHLLSDSLDTVVREVSGALRRPVNHRPVLLACSEGDQHSLPLQVLAAALAEIQIGTRVLGAALPREALSAAVRRLGPAVVLVYARVQAQDEQLGDLPRMRPAPHLLLGGPGWETTDLPPGAARVASLRQAHDQIRALLVP